MFMKKSHFVIMKCFTASKKVPLWSLGAVCQLLIRLLCSKSILMLLRIQLAICVLSSRRWVFQLQNSSPTCHRSTIGRETGSAPRKACYLRLLGLGWGSHHKYSACVSLCVCVGVCVRVCALKPDWSLRHDKPLITPRRAAPAYLPYIFISSRTGALLWQDNWADSVHVGMGPSSAGK